MLLTRNRHTRSLTLPDTIDLAGPGTFGDPAAMSDDGRVVDATFDRGITGVGGVAVVDVRRRSVLVPWD